MSLVTYKKFNMHVVMPHEALMALEPDAFPWECKAITDYNILLERIEDSDKSENVEDIFKHEFSADSEALVAIQNDNNKALVPIFSSQVI